MKLKPIGDRLFVQKEKTSESRVSGIVLTEPTKNQTAGVVVAIGKEVTQVKVGDRIHFRLFAADEFEADGVEYLKLFESDVFAVEEDV